MFALYKIAGAFAAPPGLFVIILLAMAAVLFLKSRRASRAFGTAASACALRLRGGALRHEHARRRAASSPDRSKQNTPRSFPPDGETAAFLVLAGGSSYDAAGSSVQPSRSRSSASYTAVTLASGRAGKSVLVHVGRQRLRRQGLLRGLRHAATQRERWAGAAR